jgi:hypothetical protein
MGRRSLARHFQLRALELNQRSLRLLDEPPSRTDGAGTEWIAEVRDAVAASEVCWRVMRRALKRRRAEPDWRSVRDNLQRVERLLRAPSPDNPALQRLLRSQSRWLSELVSDTPPREADLQQEIVRVYRRARRALRNDPADARARRRLSRLLILVELLQAGSGPIEGGRLTDLAARGARLQRLQWLHRRQRQRRRRETFTVMRHLAASSLAQRPGEFAQSLPWELFRALAEDPRPHNVAGARKHG